MLPCLPSLGRQLAIATRSCCDLSERRLVKYGLTLAQWVLLTALWHQDARTVGELANHCRATEPATSNLIARMTAKGLVERRHDTTDRRQVRVYLTPKSVRLSHLAEFDREINAALLVDFNKKENDLFLAMLERVVANAEAAKS